MSPEINGKKIPELTFKYGFELDEDSGEFLTTFANFLRTKGFNPDELLFSGFNGQDILDGGGMPRYEGIFAMNMSGWQQAIEEGVENPAGYANGWPVPCIGLYDRHSLAEAHFHERFEHGANVVTGEEEGRKLFLGGEPVGGWDLSEDDKDGHFELEGTTSFIDDRVELKDVTKGDLLGETPTSVPVVEGVVHKDYPDGSPTDALVGLVFLDGGE